MSGPLKGSAFQDRVCPASRSLGIKEQSDSRNGGHGGINYAPAGYDGVVDRHVKEVIDLQGSANHRGVLAEF